MSIVKLIVENRDLDFEVKEHDGQRVVSFRDIDELHQRPDGTAKRTFRSSSKYMIEGEDYFIVKPFQKDVSCTFEIPNRGITMLTESGYLLLVKTFTDDLAWKVQRQMVKNYFKAKEIVAQQPQAPQSIEDILISALTSMKEMKQENAELRQSVRHLEVVVDNEIFINDHQRSDLKQAVNIRIGQLKAELIDAHFQGAFTALNTYFNVPQYSKIPRKDFEQAMDFIKGWYPKRKNSPN